MIIYTVPFQFKTRPENQTKTQQHYLQATKASKVKKSIILKCINISETSFQRQHKEGCLLVTGLEQKEGGGVRDRVLLVRDLGSRHTPWTRSPRSVVSLPLLISHLISQGSILRILIIWVDNAKSIDTGKM